MNTILECPVHEKQHTTILLDRETIADKRTGILIVTNGKITDYDAPEENIEIATQVLTTPKSWDYTPFLLESATPKTEVLRIQFSRGIGALKTSLITDLVMNVRFGSIQVVRKSELFEIRPKIIVETELLSDFAESILKETFEIHRL